MPRNDDESEEEPSMMTADEFEKMDTVLDRSKIGCPKATLVLWVIAGVVAISCACIVGWALVSTVMEKPPPAPSAANTAQLHMYQQKVKEDMEKEKLIVAEVQQDIVTTKGDVSNTKSDKATGNEVAVDADKQNLEQDAVELKKDKANLIEIANEVKNDQAKEQAAIDALEEKGGRRLRRRLLRGVAATYANIRYTA
jgi:ribosomal protein L18